MGFYDLSVLERQKLIGQMEEDLVQDILADQFDELKRYSINEDTYIRKNTYLILGRLYRDNQNLRDSVYKSINYLVHLKDEKARQTAVYALGEIGKTDPHSALDLLGRALTDKHHSVRNATIGALKQMGEKNPAETIVFAHTHLHNHDPKIRREIIHGLELRGRTNPEDILPLLKELENDQDRTIQKTIIHVLGQISYKKGCLEKVIEELKSWGNQELVAKALDEILAVHKRYERFSAKSYKEAHKYIYG